MIRKTIIQTMKSTFIVHIPDKNFHNFPFPTGTGFFISKNGYFITANHVIDEVNDFSKVRFSQPNGEHILYISLIKKWENYDIALLKADFELNQKRYKNAKNKFLKGQKNFPYLEIYFEEHLEGTPIYSYGFPLPKVEHINLKNMKIVFVGYCPRATSAIISSKYEIIKPIRSKNDPKFYTIDKSLVYGNSGGPVVLTETGKVFGVVCRFQPVPIPQSEGSRVIIPTNYGIVSSLSNIKNYLQSELNV
ncbi:MAG: S1 family peptidase [Promethearchaeota archaeon]